MNKYAIATAIILATGAAYAADTKTPQVVACQSFTVATTTDGAKIGICGAKKEGGKATFLRSFAQVSVVNPATEKAELVMVGFK